MTVTMFVALIASLQSSARNFEGLRVNSPSGPRRRLTDSESDPVPLAAAIMMFPCQGKFIQTGRARRRAEGTGVKNCRAPLEMEVALPVVTTWHGGTWQVPWPTYPARGRLIIVIIREMGEVD